MKWLNETTLTLANCQQLQPKLDKKGEIVRGYLLPDGRFKKDKKGPDIEHEPIPGQVELPDDDPRVLAFLERMRQKHERPVKSFDERVDEAVSKKLKDLGLIK